MTLFTGIRRCCVVASVAVMAARSLAADVVIDGGNRHQTIEGFGSCLISWEDRMQKFYATPAAQEAFTNELRFNILRCNLWGTANKVEKPEQISFKTPDFEHNEPRTATFIAFAKAVMKTNPNLKVIGTVWSPPPWMKENNSIQGTGAGGINGENYGSDKGDVNNRVKREYYPHFARWLVEMVKYYRANGVPLYAVSCANEPQFTQGFESCVWTADDLATVTGMVGDLLAKEGLQTKVFGPETMSGFNWPGGPNRNYVAKFAANPSVMKHLAFFATHGYADGVVGDMSKNSSAQFWDIIKDSGKEYWMTEGGTGGHDIGDAVGDKGVAAALFNALVGGNVSAFVPWQYAGDRDEHCLMPTDGPTKKTYVCAQFSRWIPVGSVRVDSEPAYGDVNVGAFVAPKNAGATIVIWNPSSSEQPVNLTLKGQALTAAKKFAQYRTSADENLKSLDAVTQAGGKIKLTVPAQSVVTLTTLK